MTVVELLNKAVNNHRLSDTQMMLLAQEEDIALLARAAMALRDRGHGNNVSYSKKVFLPLTQLCRDVCHYCTFAQTPNNLKTPYLSVEEVLAVARRGVSLGCKEALFTLGEKPELRYRVAREALAGLGYKTTLEYTAAVAKMVFEETGLLPHINAGCMTAQEIELLRPVSASMGIMLESVSPRLCEKGMPHYGSPDKSPAVRLETIKLAGEAKIPFTSGILIGIGETREERVESLLALRRQNDRQGHLQEIIIQNFRAKPGTLMAMAPEPNLNELLWTIAMARILFGPKMNIQAPPNLSPGVLPQLIDAGINDWGGVSPVTPDFVNPEAPWPELEKLAMETRQAGKYLQERLTVYPAFARNGNQWLAPKICSAVLRHMDSDGFARTDTWYTGEEAPPPQHDWDLIHDQVEPDRVTPAIIDIVMRARNRKTLSEAEVTRLFEARGPDFSYVCQAADQLRKQVAGEQVTYVVNRNINYTNICYFKCRFCAFSKGKLSEKLRGRPYNLNLDEIARRSLEAWERGATEVCLQGGIHPEYTGQTYLDICNTIKQVTPDMHIHAFSPLEVWQGASTLGISVEDFLTRLKAAGLRSLPGTAAEVLDDSVREVICADKVNTRQWLEVMETAHRIGLRTTATIMFGHVDQPLHWARHLLRIRSLQARTGGFTEFVPLPFVAAESPIYLKGRSRKGPTFRESVLMHAVARLVLHPYITNIQASWVKLGKNGVEACLNAGVNDLGGTLMNESITRAAGAKHGQETSPEQMESRICGAKRKPLQRLTLYQGVSNERRNASFGARPIAVV